MEEQAEKPDLEVEENTKDTDIESSENESDDKADDVNDESDESTESPSPKGLAKHAHHWHNFVRWFGSHKKWSIPIAVFTLLIILGTIPLTRDNIAGLFIKKSFSLVVNDSIAKTPVAQADVDEGQKNYGVTNGNGKIVMHLSPGKHLLKIFRSEYKDDYITVNVHALGNKVSTVELQATGRLALIRVTDRVSNQTITNYTLKFLGKAIASDSKGNGYLVVPVGLANPSAKIIKTGYNDTDFSIKVNNSDPGRTFYDANIARNDVAIMPAGKLYFLSKLSGTIDVVKTNLDGTNRQTVISGTGKEDDSNTVMLASRDWQYLALQSKRGGTDALYAINTNDDKLLNMDEGGATFRPIGWSGHYFIYFVFRAGYSNWQPNATSIKSYNADTGQILTLANTSAQGSSNSDAQYENIWSAVIDGGDVVYAKIWYRYPGYLAVSGKQDVLTAIHPDGTSSRQLKSVDAGTMYISNLVLSKPHELDFGIYATNGGSDATFYTMDKNSSISENSAITDQTINNATKIYLISPSSNQSFWGEERDGKQTLFVGDEDGSNPQQVATLSAYTPYGWYSDKYLLVSKEGSELYIMPAGGIKADSEAIKITDYHKPAYNFYGYGGGYGGL